MGSTGMLWHRFVSNGENCEIDFQEFTTLYRRILYGFVNTIRQNVIGPEANLFREAQAKLLFVLRPFIDSQANPDCLHLHYILKGGKPLVFVSNFYDDEEPPILATFKSLPRWPGKNSQSMS